jgi:putative flippase GtrA
MSLKKAEHLKRFFRYNIVALLATTLDFSLFIIFTDIFQIWYVASTFASAIIGGSVAFFLERNWTFVSKDGKFSLQAIKYLIVWIISILLNTLGLYLMVEYTNIDQVISKVIVSVTVGIGFNFLMHNFFVFK